MKTPRSRDKQLTPCVNIGSKTYVKHFCIFSRRYIDYLVTTNLIETGFTFGDVSSKSEHIKQNLIHSK